MSQAASDHPREQFLVCGFGSLGQHCVAHLKKFGAGVSAIDRVSCEVWEIESVPDLLDTFPPGDCRHPVIPGRIGIEKYRAILFCHQQRPCQY